MKLTAIANALNATQIESIDVWAKVLLVKATVNGKTVVRFVSKKLIAAEISAKIANLSAEYNNEECAHEYSSKGSLESFIKHEMRAAIDAAIAKFNREASMEAKWDFWMSQLGMGREQFKRGANFVNGLSRRDAVKNFSTEANFNRFMEAVAALMPWIEVVEAYAPMKPHYSWN